MIIQKKKEKAGSGERCWTRGGEMKRRWGRGAGGGWVEGRRWGKERVGGGHLFLRLCVGYEEASPGAQSPGFV